jgi:NAD(P)-dependent dehydrogenase (short-subunit alcohol dehydrogenase family)
MNKVILITGTSSGFGKLIAQTLAKAGHTIYASMRDIHTKNAENAALLQRWASENNSNLKVIELDVTNPEQADNVVREVVSKQGSLDILINNAGQGSRGITEDYTPELVKQQFDTNVFGVFYVTKAAIPVMRKAQSGLIITISSGLGRVVIPTLGIYGASKFAVEAMAEGWRYELGPVGIDSIIVEPGIFPTTNFGASALANSPQSSGRIYNYPGLKDFIDGYSEQLQESIKNGTANNPQDVADTVKSLIEIPYGSRPLRTVVDKTMEPALRPLNQHTDEIQSQILHAYQTV